LDKGLAAVCVIPEGSLQRSLTGRCLRSARIALSLAFLLTGFTFAVWVVNIPAVAGAVRASNAVLGSSLLVLGLGSVVSMQLAGALASRTGTKVLVAVGSALLAVGLLTASFANNLLFLVVALLVLGLGNGSMDVAMNDQAVVLQREYGRPIMSSCHALFSVGGAAGALYGALTQALQVSYPLALLAAGGVSAVLGLISAAGLLPQDLRSSSQGRASAVNPAVTRLGVRSQVVALAALAFSFMLAEGVVSDWSALHATQHLREPASSASLAYVAFAATMTVGRLGADRVVAAIGPVRLVRIGTLGSILGLAVVVASPFYPLTLGGWMLFGLGLSGILPQVYSAAGALDDRGAILLSRVISVGYLGMLAGPASVGWLSAAVGIDLALLLPLGLMLLGFGAARSVRRASSDLN
jgi:MFS family permease